MRSLLLAAALLAPAAAARADVVVAAAPAPSDWRRASLTDEQRRALTDAGYRLEADGRVLDARDASPLNDDQLASALAKLGLTAQQLALEHLRLLLSKPALTADDRAQIARLRASLPDDAAKALDSGASVADLRRLADQDLDRISAYFDAARAPGERAADAAPVVLGAPSPRALPPYSAPAEKTLGDSLRSAAARTLGADPVGREVLARLNGRDGRPVLPPIVVEDAPDGAAAAYNYRRRALIVDRESFLDSIVGGVPAPRRAALRASLTDRSALIAYANAHPAAVAAFAAQNDALLAHELTHAWQDRRDAVMQEMSRGALPTALIVDDEVEAWTVKNLYIASRLKSDPRAAIDPNELADFARMTADYERWRQDLVDRYQSAAAGALDLRTIADLQDQRVARTRGRSPSTPDEQSAKSLDLLMQTRAQRELAAAASAEAARLDALRGRAAKAAAEAPRLLRERGLAASPGNTSP